MRKFLVRLTNWEYWPFSVLYFPVFFYYAWLSIRNRSLFFFTSSNPSIEFGGMFGERKSDIFELIPEKYIPKTFLIQKGDRVTSLEKANEIGFPLIAKPNIGERGTWVKKLATPEELEAYTRDCPVDFLLQELVSHPMELGVFYVRYPNEEKGRITSIVRKHFLSVTGDGKSTVMELLLTNDRAILTANLESDRLRGIGDSIPKKGEEVLIEPIGNHCRGTQFLNDTPEIDASLNEAFDRLAHEIPDFYFGRFDLRCRSYEDLRTLSHFKILELNGAGAEPGHIYQPGYPLLKAYRDILWHLRALAHISRLNKERGVSYWSFRHGYQKWKQHQRYNQKLSV